MKIGATDSNRRARRVRALDDALLPLVNIVFLLMIFFLMAGRLGGPRLDAATKSSQAQQATAAQHVLQLLPEGGCLLGDLRFPDSELATQAAGWRGEAVDLRVRGDVAAERVLRALAVLRKSGTGELRLLTQRSAGG